jgi:hypothetical protein
LPINKVSHAKKGVHEPWSKARSSERIADRRAVYVGYSRGKLAEILEGREEERREPDLRNLKTDVKLEFPDVLPKDFPIRRTKIFI